MAEARAEAGAGGVLPIFGGGPHFCLGYHLAMFEGVSFLARVAKVLSAANKRPATSRVPRPTFFPLTRPPGKTTIDFVTA
jgi:cytochrome P450 monooxygenase